MRTPVINSSAPNRFSVRCRSSGRVRKCSRRRSICPAHSPAARSACACLASGAPGTRIATPPGSPMKIAQIAPLAESVPPRLYGGTERVVFYLTEELVRLGHDVTLFASGDSETSAELVPCTNRALRLSGVQDPTPYLALMLEMVRQRTHEFDVLHFHLDHLHLPLFRPMARKTVTTMHGRLDLPALAPLYREFADMPLVSISNSQREPLPSANWVATVHHGLASEICPFNPAPRGGYFAFLGRLSPEKGVERAIEIARRSGVRLRVAAKIDPTEQRYFRERVEPLLGL